MSNHPENENPSPHAAPPEWVPVPLETILPFGSGAIEDHTLSEDHLACSGLLELSFLDSSAKHEIDIVWELAPFRTASAEAIKAIKITLTLAAMKFPQFNAAYEDSLLACLHDFSDFGVQCDWHSQASYDPEGFVVAKATVLAHEATPELFAIKLNFLRSFAESTLPELETAVSNL